MSTSWSSAQAGRFDGRTRDDGDALKRSAQLGQTITPLLMDVTNRRGARIGGRARRLRRAERVGGQRWNRVAVPKELVPLESLRWQLEVNVVGQVAVTQAFLPMLRQARGRMVIICSIGDRFTRQLNMEPIRGGG